MHHLHFVMVLCFLSLSSQQASGQARFLRPDIEAQSDKIGKKLYRDYQNFLVTFLNGIYCDSVGDGYDDLIESECRRVVFAEQEKSFRQHWAEGFLYRRKG